MSRTVAYSAVGLTDAQRVNASVVEALFTAAGYSPSTIAAAIVNALAESGLNAAALGDGGKSVGLFQLNTVAGAGKGHGVVSLQNAAYNTNTLLSVEKKALAKVEAVAKTGASVSTLAAAFAQLVERPSNVATAMASRAARAAIVFPLGAGGASSSRSPVGVAFVVGACALAYWALTRSRLGLRNPAQLFDLDEERQERRLLEELGVKPSDPDYRKWLEDARTSRPTKRTKKPKK